MQSRLPAHCKNISFENSFLKDVLLANSKCICYFVITGSQEITVFELSSQSISFDSNAIIFYSDVSRSRDSEV